MKTKQLTQLAMLAAVSIVLMMFVRFPFPPAPHIEYTPSEAVQILAVLLYGTIPALVLTVVVALVQGFTVSAAAGPFGIIMNILGTASFVLVIGLITRPGRAGGQGGLSGLGDKRVLIGLGAGIAATVAAMIIGNIIITPLFIPAVTAEMVLGMIVPIFLPYNLMRAAANAVIGFLVWKALSRIIRRQP